MSNRFKKEWMAEDEAELREVTNDILYFQERIKARTFESSPIIVDCLKDIVSVLKLYKNKKIKEYKENYGRDTSSARLHTRVREPDAVEDSRPRAANIFIATIELKDVGHKTE